MRNYNTKKEAESLIDSDMMGLVSAIHEYKGKQELYLASRPEILDRLTEIAKIQSTESSNRIEGIQTSRKRLLEIMAEKTEPRNRDQEEIAGYRDVLSIIHESHDNITLTPSNILALHNRLYAFAKELDIGGHWKIGNNEIREYDGKGGSFVRFKPVDAYLVPENMDSACASFQEAIEDGTEPLLAIPLFILDFLCIHPFTDGNGRMSRLLTLLLLYRSGYLVGKYISIEMLIGKSKETYYDSLKKSDQGWADDGNDPRAFVHYLLGVILKAYREFEERYKETMKEKTGSKERVFSLISTSLAPLTKKDITELCPEFAEKTIEVALGLLLKEGRIVRLGNNRSASYQAKQGITHS
jgi:Fic family protein